ncbi:MAG: hypothetical protein RID07_13450 [Lacipirellulaceae bacterium]
MRIATRYRAVQNISRSEFAIQIPFKAFETSISEKKFKKIEKFFRAILRSTRVEKLVARSAVINHFLTPTRSA